MDLKEKIAKNVEKLKEEKRRLEEENEQLREKVASLEARREAEDILLEARDSEEAPSKLSPNSIDGFLSKRAELEDKPDDELEKLAQIIKWAEDDDGLEITDFDDGEVKKGNLTEWLRQQA